MLNIDSQSICVSPIQESPHRNRNKCLLVGTLGCLSRGMLRALIFRECAKVACLLRPLTVTSLHCFSE